MMSEMMEGKRNFLSDHTVNSQRRKVENSTESWLILTWGTFLLLFLGSLLVAFGLPFGPISLAVVAVASVIAYRYTYFSFYLALILVMLLGLTVSIPVAEQDVVGRAFGGSIDLFLGEIVIVFVLSAWMVKVFLLWFRRRDVNWRPILPIWKSYAALIAAHIVSIFSSYGPDVVMALKYVLRPVTFCYVAFIALPVNIIRSRRRLRATLGVLTAVGLIACLDGLLSMWSFEFFASDIRRAHPIPLFGMNLFGDNHNLLAELLLISAPSSLALAFMSRKPNVKYLLYAACGLQTLIALLTLSRTAWLVAIFQSVFLALTLWRQEIRKYAFEIAALVILMVPLAAFQLQFSFSTTAQSSNTTRWMLSDIALFAFKEHPWIGGGAGTFVWRVGNAEIFIKEFGGALDAHGFIQKLMAETGISGLLAYALVLISGMSFIYRRLSRFKGDAREVSLILCASAAGAVAYQFANTAYWTAHMWLPIGVLFAALLMFESEAAREAETEVFAD